jgi:hypothetical protein
LPVLGLLAVPLAGLYVAAAAAQKVGPRAAQPYRFHRSRKRHHLTAVQAGRWIGKMVHRSGLPDPRPSGCAKGLTLPMTLVLAAVWLLLDYPWGLCAFVAIAALYGLR